MSFIKIFSEIYIYLFIYALKTKIRTLYLKNLVFSARNILQWPYKFRANIDPIWYRTPCIMYTVDAQKMIIFKFNLKLSFRNISTSFWKEKSLYRKNSNRKKLRISTRQEAGLTRTGVWQAGTRRLKVLNDGTFLYRMHSGPTVGRNLNLFCKLETKFV